MAYQECLASNVPVFAWDEGIWPNPVAKELGIGPVRCVSVPYFDDRCGVKFSAANMLESWEKFYAGIDAFTPRRFIAETMTLQNSADAYLRAYRETGEVGLRAVSKDLKDVAVTARPSASLPELIRST
jgi:hypothetical protein